MQFCISVSNYKDLRANKVDSYRSPVNVTAKWEKYAPNKYHINSQERFIFYILNAPEGPMGMTQTYIYTQ